MIINDSLVLLGIVSFFTLFVVLRHFLSLRICALCGAVSVTWLALLAFFYFGQYANPILIGILMGGSIVGSLYFLEGKLPERWHMFRLPFFLTLIFVTYFALGRHFKFEVVGILLLLWILTATIYAGRNKPKLKALGMRIIECCKNW